MAAIFLTNNSQISPIAPVNNSLPWALPAQHTEDNSNVTTVTNLNSDSYPTYTAEERISAKQRLREAIMGYNLNNHEYITQNRDEMIQAREHIREEINAQLQANREALRGRPQSLRQTTDNSVAPNATTLIDYLRTNPPVVTATNGSPITDYVLTTTVNGPYTSRTTHSIPLTGSYGTIAPSDLEEFMQYKNEKNRKAKEEEAIAAAPVSTPEGRRFDDI